MADNTTLPVGGGGDTIADEDIAGVKYQRIKLVDATAGSTTPIGTTANPMPVSLALSTLDLATGSGQSAMVQAIATLLAQILACDTNNVNIAGGQIAVSSMPAVNATVTATIPLPVTPSLSPNAAQETGGNLDSLTAVMKDMQQMIAQQGAVMQLLLQQQNQIAFSQGAQTTIYQ